MSTMAGRMSIARTLCLASSTDSASVRPLMACLVAEYTASWAVPKIADADVVERQSELSVDRSSGILAWMTLRPPTRFTLTTDMIWSQPIDSNGPLASMPALLKSRSRRPPVQPAKASKASRTASGR